MKRTHDQLKIEHFTAGVLAIAGCFLMVAFPRVTQSGVSSGLELFWGSVLPTLFPFFVLTNLIGLTSVPVRIAHLFEPLFRRMFGVSGRGAYVLTLSLVSGYPMAAKLVGEGCREGSLTAVEGKRILSFSSLCGPLFMIGTVGTAMLGMSQYGYLIAAGHYLGALINGLLWSRFLLAQSCDQRRFVPATAFGGSLFEVLSQSILKAFSSMGLICGYIVLFSVLSEFLIQSGVLKAMEHSWLRILISGGMEMTMGCRDASKTLSLTVPIKLALCSFMISFGGGSIAGQSLSMLTDSGIEASYYIKTKVCHGVLAGILTYNFTLLAERFGFMDLAVGAIYGANQIWLQSLGAIHLYIFTVRSMVVVLGLMILLVGIDQLIHSSHEKLHAYIIERRKKEP